MPEDVLDHPATQDVYDFLVDKVVPGQPTPEQEWDFGTIEAPNQAEIDLYNSMRISYTAPDSVRGTEDRVVEATAALAKGGKLAPKYIPPNTSQKRLTSRQPTRNAKRP
jgi:hypothetical protein